MLTFYDFWSQKFAPPGQYFCARVFSHRLGAALAYLALRAGLSPNQVTLAGLLTMLAANACLAWSSGYDGFLLFALALYQIGFGLDCADGQLARGTQRCSAYGAWLDVTADHIRNIGILLALATNVARQAELDIPAVIALFLLGIGLSVGLHTVSVLKSGEYRPHGLRQWRAQAKQMVKELTDTPLFLLSICLLLPLRPLLLAYIALCGLLYLLVAVVQAGLRIKATRAA
ncbi:MAG TPA: CDP-alcohol phosphatidyltransferase family protein [Nevskiales bacterium]|nr:CDP-alcohol phosphatidyltransferase family protein [Nevskiales bacterium]